MCGIVAGISNKNVLPKLIEGLERLEYRGYDSAGVAILNASIRRVRSTGRVTSIKTKVQKTKLEGLIGIGHTRWATHGGVTEENAHPHISNNKIALVHNGIIENHEEQSARLKKLGYKFESETDTEVIAHLIDHYHKKNDLLKSTQLATKDLTGAYAIAVISIDNKDEISLDVGVFKIVIPFNDAEADVEYGIPFIEKSISIVGSPCRPLNIISNGIPSQSSILLELTEIIGKGSTVTSTVALEGILVQLFPSVIEVMEIVTGLLIIS